jgi:hypothetical protein
MNESFIFHIYKNIFFLYIMPTPYPTCETIPELCVCNQYPVRKLIVVNGKVEVLFLYKGVPS